MGKRWPVAALALSLAILNLGCSTPRAPAPSNTLDQLIRRPLTLPSATSGCPASRPAVNLPQGFSYNHAVGSGPVYATGSDLSSVVSAGTLTKVLWVSLGSYQGPVLIRGQKLDGLGPVLFSEASQNSPVIRTVASQGNTVNLYDGLSFQATKGSQSKAERAWPSFVYVELAGCFGLQIDGEEFSSVIVFLAG